MLLRDERFHLLRCKRGVREFNTRRFNRTSSTAFLDDEPEKGAKTFVTGNRQYNFTTEISFQRKKEPSLILIIVDIASIIDIKLRF